MAKGAVRNKTQGTLGDGRRAQILAERAASLAAAPPPPPRYEVAALLALPIEQNLYGAPSDAVTRVRPFKGCSPAPGSTPAFLGLAADGGRIWQVLDLPTLLGHRRAASPGGWLLFLRSFEGLCLLCPERPDMVEAELLEDEDLGRARTLEETPRLMGLISFHDLMLPLLSRSNFGSDRRVHR